MRGRARGDRPCVPRSRRTALIGTTGVTLAYVVAYPWLYRLLDDSAGFIDTVPVIVAAWCCGPAMGATAGFMSFPLNLALAVCFSDQSLGGWVAEDVVMGTLAETCLGLCVGWLHELERRARRELAARERIETTLQESERRFQALAENSAAIVTLIEGTHCTFVNATAERMTGYTRDELLAMDYWALVHPEDREQVRQRWVA